MLTDAILEGAVAAAQEDLLDSPQCSHTACILLKAAGFGADDYKCGTDPYYFYTTATCKKFLDWVDANMYAILNEIRKTDSIEMAKAEMAIWFAHGLALGKKLGRVGEPVG